MKRKNRYPAFSRGQVVQVNFDPQVGCEIKGIHYAIVVTNFDKTWIGTITVVPLTSKNKNHLVPLGEWLSDTVMNDLELQARHYMALIKKIQAELDYLEAESKNGIEVSNKKKQTLLSDIDTFDSNMKYFQSACKKYKNIQKSSFANVLQITSIDKSKVLNPCNRLDPIRRIKAPARIMDQIDEALIRSFTKAIK